MNPPRTRLKDEPLWKLLVMLDDVERSLGPGSDTARCFVRLIEDRMRQERRQPVSGDASAKK
jgi:hypothetical protein